MCGLVGIAGPLEGRHLQWFNNALVFDAVRGIHGTGVMSVAKDMARAEFPVDWFKRAGNPFELMEMRGYDRAVNVNKRMLAGHNRFGTKGGQTTKNAHPFDFENVIGMHNGTLKWDAEKRMGYKWNEFGTDSEQIYAHINDHGVGDTIKLLEGAWSLVWYDKQDDTINFLRNDERPMFIGFADDRKFMLWGSEQSIIRCAASKERADIDIQNMIYTTPNMHYKFKLPEGKDDVFLEPVRTKHEGFQSPPPFQLGFHRPNQAKPYYAVGGNTATKKNDEKPSDSADNTGSPADENMKKFIEALREIGDDPGEILKLKQEHQAKHEGPVSFIPKDHQGVVLAPKAFEHATKCGCGWCGDPVFFGEQIKFIDRETFLCSTCLTDPEAWEAVNQEMPDEFQRAREAQLRSLILA